jgi:hypothetical protein
MSEFGKHSIRPGSTKARFPAGLIKRLVRKGVQGKIGREQTEGQFQKDELLKKNGASPEVVSCVTTMVASKWPNISSAEE